MRHLARSSRMRLLGKWLVPTLFALAAAGTATRAAASVAHAVNVPTARDWLNAVYGLFDEDVDENVIESHISKLRKKLKHRLGFDPIDSKRFLGYCIEK